MSVYMNIREKGSVIQTYLRSGDFNLLYQLINLDAGILVHSNSCTVKIVLKDSLTMKILIFTGCSVTIIQSHEKSRIIILVDDLKKPLESLSLTMELFFFQKLYLWFTQKLYTIN